MNEIEYWENKDTSEIINMFMEKQFIYRSCNKIAACKKFDKYFEKYLDRRIIIGRKRMELYRRKVTQ